MDYDSLNDFISNSINFSKKIFKYYNRLSFLERSALKDMPIYKSTCLDLKKMKECEQEYYDSFSFSDDEIDYMVRFIAMNYNIDFNITIENLMHNQNCNNLIPYRVIFKLEELSDIVIHIENCEMDQEEMQNQIKFQKQILRNYCLVIESFVKKYLSMENDFKKELLYIKYLFPFINSSIEEIFLKEYDFKEQLYLDYKMYGDFFRISESIQQRFINLQLFNRFIDEINNFLEISDDLFDVSQASILISEIILKSISVFFDNEFIDNTIADLEEHIRENGQCYLNNRLAVLNILNLGDITKKDKENFSYLSLRLPK